MIQQMHACAFVTWVSLDFEAEYSIHILTIVWAGNDGAWADSGHVTHCGTLVVVGAAAPPGVGAAGAVL